MRLFFLAAISATICSGGFAFAGGVTITGSQGITVKGQPTEEKNLVCKKNDPKACPSGGTIVFSDTHATNQILAYCDFSKAIVTLKNEVLCVRK